MIYKGQFTQYSQVNTKLV